MGIPIRFNTVNCYCDGKKGKGIEKAVLQSRSLINPLQSSGEVDQVQKHVSRTSWKVVMEHPRKLGRTDHPEGCDGGSSVA